MDLEPISAVAVAGLGLAGVYLQNRRNEHAYDQIRQELEVLSLLPEGSELRAPLQARAEQSLRDLLENRSAKTRDWSGVGIAIFLLVVAILLGLPMLDGGWWWLLALPVGFCALFGVVGFIESITPAERDATGRRISRASDDSESASG